MATIFISYRIAMFTVIFTSYTELPFVFFPYFLACADFPGITTNYIFAITLFIVMVVSFMDRFFMDFEKIVPNEENE